MREEDEDEGEGGRGGGISLVGGGAAAVRAVCEVHASVWVASSCHIHVIIFLLVSGAIGGRFVIC